MPDLIRSALLQGMPELIKELGGNADALLGQFAYTESDLRSPDSLTSYRNFMSLLNCVADELHCPHFGLMLSRQQDFATLGMLGMVMQQEDTLSQALDVFARYFFMHMQASTVEFSVLGKSLIGTFDVCLESSPDTRQAVTLAIGHGLNIFRFLGGKDLSPNAVHFRHSPPQDLRPYREIFACPVHFNAQFDGLVYNASILEIPVRGSDEQFRRVMHRQLNNIEQQYPDDLIAQVKLIIKTMLSTRHCNIDLVAGAMNMSKRTLQIKLKANGAGFQQLFDEVRADIASQYIGNRSVSMTQLAEVLGYSELSAFTRAFNRWFGMSPRQWQKRCG